MKIKSHFVLSKENLKSTRTWWKYDINSSIVLKNMCPGIPYTTYLQFWRIMYI